MPALVYNSGLKTSKYRALGPVNRPRAFSITNSIGPMSNSGDKAIALDITFSEKKNLTTSNCFNIFFCGCYGGHKDLKIRLKKW